MRSRTQFPAENGGLPCQGSFTESRTCNTNPCAVASPCSWNPWSEWGACTWPYPSYNICTLLSINLIGSLTCGGGTRTRTRSQNAAVNGGAPCVGSSSEVVACNTQPCPTPVDCTWNPWSTWSACSMPCTIPSLTLQLSGVMVLIVVVC